MERATGLETRNPQPWESNLSALYLQWMVTTRLSLTVTPLRNCRPNMNACDPDGHEILDFRKASKLCESPKRDCGGFG